MGYCLFLVRIEDEVRTFMFTDIQGSTRLWEEHEQAMGAVLARHDRVVEAAVTDAGGQIFKHMGDGIAASFPDPRSAAQAAIRAQVEIDSTDWGVVGELRARMGIHAGPAQQRGTDFFGRNVNRCARLMGAAHGGQVVISAVSAEHLHTTADDEWTITDLGVHQLRDLSQPERVLQLCHPALRSSFPPLSTVDTIPRDLPESAELFTGREREIREVVELQKRSRLITISGAGGVGKTQLAVAAGHAVLRDYPDGSWFCPIRAGAEPDEIADQIADRLGIGVDPDLSATQRLTSGLGTKRAMLIFDNAESSLDATKVVVSAVLAGCVNASLMVTSRELLKVRGEQALVVGPLELPSQSDHHEPAIARRSPAVRLFERRALQADPAFTLTVENLADVIAICERLDGLPLAVELAAAQMATFDPKTLSERLQTRVSLIDDRDRTLAAIVDWSYGTLSAGQQRLFRRLAVFGGGFGLSAAEHVCSDEEPGSTGEACASGEPWLLEADVMPLLSDLVSKSVIVAERSESGRRYRMLALLREYALERLQEADELTTVRNRHLQHYLSLGAEAEVGLRGEREVAWVAQLNTEFGNLRSAFDWAIQSGQASEAFRLIRAAYSFARERPRFEVLGWAGEASQVADPDDPGRTSTLTVLASGAAVEGNYAEALRLGEEASAICVDPEGPDAFKALRIRVIASILSQGATKAAGLCREAIACANRAGLVDQRIEFEALLAMAMMAGGDMDSARHMSALALDGARELRNPSILAFSLYVAGSVEDDVERSIALLEEGIEFADRVENRYVLANALQLATWKRGATGDRRAAEHGFAQVMQHWHRIGNWSSFEMTLRMACESLAGGDRDELLATFIGWLKRRDGQLSELVGDSTRFVDARATIAENLGDLKFEIALHRGQMMEPAELVSITRAQLIHGAAPRAG